MWRPDPIVPPGIGDSAVTIINFYNLADHALNGWEINQFSKPDDGWGYSIVLGQWYRDRIIDTELTFPQDTWEIYSHIAQARSRALGAEGNTANLINGGSVDLGGNPYLYGNEKHEHSAQFNSINMRRYSYWKYLLLRFGVVTE